MKKLVSVLLTAVLLVSLVLAIPASADELPQSIGLTGVTNARQLGGYVGADGRTVKDGALIRTAKLADATDEDLDKLANVYHVSKVIDFRTLVEATSAADPTIAGASNTRMSAIDVGTSAFEIVKLVGEASSGTAAIDLDTIKSLVSLAQNGVIGTIMKDQYEGLVSDVGSIVVYRQFFNMLLSANGETVLYHCTSGKDRAGVATILLLSALGVDKETIKQDFLLSNQYYADQMQEAYDKAYSVCPIASVATDVSRAYGVDEAWFNAVYSTIQSKYGSMDIYLKLCMGLSNSDLQQLRDAYLN